MSDLVERLRDYAKYEIRSDRELANEAADEVERLRAALKDLLSTSYAEECQECGIGHTEQWKRAKTIIAGLGYSD